MSTIREQIVAAVVAAMTTGRPQGVPAPVRTRIDSPAADQLPALTVYQASETVEPMQDYRAGRGSRGPVVRRSLLLNVEALTKAGSAEEPDKAADPILAWASQSIATLATSAKIWDVSELGTRFEYACEAETAFCRATMTFMFSFDTLVNDPERID